MNLYKHIAVGIFVMVAIVSGLSADSQLDLGINLPVATGIVYNGETVADTLSFTLPIPDLTYNYYFGPEFLQIGAGFRVWSVIIATAAYPVVSAQLQLKPLVVQANIGGGVFAWYIPGAGLGLSAGNVFFPELSASLMLGKNFSLGVGVLGLYAPGIEIDEMGYTINVIARFRLIDK